MHPFIQPFSRPQVSERSIPGFPSGAGLRFTSLAGHTPEFLLAVRRSVTALFPSHPRACLFPDLGRMLTRCPSDQASVSPPRGHLDKVLTFSDWDESAVTFVQGNQPLVTSSWIHSRQAATLLCAVPGLPSRPRTPVARWMAQPMPSTLCPLAILSRRKSTAK